MVQNNLMYFAELDYEEIGRTWVIEIHVSPGQFLNKEETVITIECEKATVEIPSPKAGVVKEILVKIGDDINDKTPIIEFESDENSYQVEEKEDSLGRIFLVHGHNEALREMSARFMEKLGLDVIILHERPNEGKTIIEKFESNSNVDFAVVLMTADDKGGTVSSSASDHRLRARQNVIFELGYFIGKLGRKKVCALYEQGVEIPTDYHGVVYVEFDDKGMWRFQLAKELKNNGINIDLNKLV